MNIEECSWSGTISCYDAHPLLNNSFHPGYTDAQLVLDKVTNGTYPSIAQMVDIIGRFKTVIHQDHVFYNANNILFR